MRPGLVDLARAELLHPQFDVECLVGHQQHALVHRAKSVEIKRDVVLARLRAESLEHAVEVVDKTRIVTVHENLRFPWFDLEAHGRIRVQVPRGRWSG